MPVYISSVQQQSDQWLRCWKVQRQSTFCKKVCWIALAYLDLILVTLKFILSEQFWIETHSRTPTLAYVATFILPALPHIELFSGSHDLCQCDQMREAISGACHRIHPSSPVLPQHIVYTSLIKLTILHSFSLPRWLLQ